MKITKTTITIKEIFKGFVDLKEEGVIAYNGKLQIRPAYQREFIYEEKQQEAVIETVRKGFPLNTIYWSKKGDNYEVLDGQQRTLSICLFLKDRFSIKDNGNDRRFSNLKENEKKAIEDYKLDIYICEGTKEEKLEWFKVINIAGKKLTDQELLNAVYTSPWLVEAKRYFSKSNCLVYNNARRYLSGNAIRQDYLETVLKWISNGEITNYMSKYQYEKNANDLINYFERVLTLSWKNFY